MVRQLRPKKLLLAGSVLGATLALAGCSAETAAQWGRFGLPEAASDRAPFVGNLWVGAWIASLVVGEVPEQGVVAQAVGRSRFTGWDRSEGASSTSLMT